MYLCIIGVSVAKKSKGITKLKSKKNSICTQTRDIFRGNVYRQQSCRVKRSRLVFEEI
jgi:hypothetical protein